MSIAQTNTMAKVAAVVAGLGLVAMTFVAAAPAKAATMFNTNLTVGSTGADVSALQTWLIGQGFSIPAGATGYFGAQTKAAVAAYQSAKGISPAVGFFGPLTRASVNANAGNGSGQGTVGVGELKGTGRVSSVDAAGDIESDLNEGDSAVKVAGAELEVKDGDIAIQRVDVELAAQGDGSNRIDRYVDSVSLWLGSKKLATMDAADGDRSGATTTFRFSNLKGVINEGDTETLYVAVDAVSSIDSNEDGDTVNVVIPADGIRVVSADGVSETVVDAGDVDEDFTVSSTDTGTITITESSDNPDDSTVKVSEDSTTDDVTLLTFNLKAKKQDVTINDIPVQLVTTHQVADTVQTVKLMKGSKVLKSKTISGTGTNATVVFNDLSSEDVSKDDTEEYSVVATIKKVATGTFVTGDTVVASTTNSMAWDTEDQEGDSATISGSAVGGTVTLQSTGITITKGATSATKSVGTTVGSGDSTQYSVAFKVTADDEDLYIGRTIARSTTASTTGITWATTTSSSAGTGSASTTLGTANLSAADTNSGDANGYYKVPAGTSRTFTLNVAINEVAGTLFTGVRVTSIGYGTTTSMGTSYTSNLDTFKTEDVSMTTH